MSMNLNESKVYAAAMMLNNAERQKVAIAILSTVGVQSDLAIVPRAEGRPLPQWHSPKHPARGTGRSEDDGGARFKSHSALPKKAGESIALPKKAGESLALPKIKKSSAHSDTDCVLTVNFHPPQKDEEEDEDEDEDDDEDDDKEEKEEPTLPSWAVEKFSMKILQHGLHTNIPKKSYFISEEDWASGVHEDSPRDISGTQIKVRTTAAIASCITEAGNLDKMLKHSNKHGVAYRFTVSLTN